MMKSKHLGIYVHIPFCIRKCQYCDFLSFPADRAGQKSYIDSLIKEIFLWKKTVSAPVADTVFIGGGTPSVLDITELHRLFESLHKAFDIKNNTEFTVECNPGTVTEEKLRLMREAGVNRISLGIQSTFDEELQALGRIHSYREATESYKLARRIGFENINIDLMAAIPKQTVSSYEKSLQRIIALSPEHISSYSLIIEEGTPFFERYEKEPPVDEDTDRRMYERTKELLDSAGYKRYEISNYAKAGKECRHNLKYWKREEYLGAGLGAASFLNGCRFQNESEMSLYRKCLEEGTIPTTEKEVLSKEEAMAEFMYLGLRCIDGIQIQTFERTFSHNFKNKYGKMVEKMVKEGLLKEENGRIFLTGRGIDLSNRVFAEFI